MKRFLTIFMAICLALSLSMVTYAAELTADEQQMQKAVTEFNNNKPEAAIATISKLIKEQPQHAAAIFERGKMYLITGQEAKAKADFDKVLSLEKDKALVNYLVGDFYAQAGKLDQGLEYINAAIAADPKIAQAYLTRAIIKQAKKETGVIEDLNKAIELEPKYADAYLNRASWYFNENNVAAAEKDLNTAVGLVENKAQINYLVAQIYARAQNVEKVIAHTTASINANASAAAYVLRANAYASQKQFAQSIADFTKAIELNPQVPAIYMERGVAYANSGDFANAMADLDKTIKLAPNLGMAYVNRGMVELAMNKQTEAKADFKKAISINAELAQIVPAEYK